jgi:hypothetical protein
MSERGKGCTPTSLVPEVEGTVWSGIRATGGLACA